MTSNDYPNKFIYRLLDKYNPTMNWLEPSQNIIAIKQNQSHIDDFINNNQELVTGLINITFASLDERLQTIMKYRYQFGYTLKRLGRTLKLSAERIRQLEQRALNDIRKNFVRQYYIPLFWSTNQSSPISRHQWIVLLKSFSENESMTLGLKEYSKFVYDKLSTNLDAKEYMTKVMNIKTVSDIENLFTKVGK